jgi:hypothetical protein
VGPIGVNREAELPMPSGIGSGDVLGHMVILKSITVNPAAAKNNAGEQQQPERLPKCNLPQLKNLRHRRVPKQLENENHDEKYGDNQWNRLPPIAASHR